LDEAIHQFQEALRRDPHDLKSRELLKQTLEKKGAPAQ
jgi:hypothetical protein